MTRYVNAIAHAIQFGSNPHPISDAKMNATSLRFLTEAQPVFERGSQLMTNVKVMASEKSFPTVGSMVEDMVRPWVWQLGRGAKFDLRDRSGVGADVRMAPNRFAACTV